MEEGVGEGREEGGGVAGGVGGEGLGAEVVVVLDVQLAVQSAELASLTQVEIPN